MDTKRLDVQALVEDGFSMETVYYVRGRHSEESVMDAVASDYGADRATLHWRGHEWWRWVPVRNENYDFVRYSASPHARGAFEVSVVEERHENAL